jgi:LPXTG-site transpeptidase (sortase) family protein
LQRLSDFAAVLLLTCGAVLIALAVWGSWSSTAAPPPPDFGSVDTTLTGFVLSPTATPAATTTVPEPTPTEAGPPPAVTRIVVPRAGIDAAVITLGVDSDGVMQSPHEPDVVAWYDFSGHPGRGSNAVFAGHVDYHDYGPAVFWHLRELELNDEIQVDLADGTSLTYRVISSQSYAADDAPIGEIVGPTAVESVTLITCTGSFDQSSRQYNQRLVVRAVRA